MTFQLFDTVVMIGLANAHVFAGVALFKTPRTRSNELLAAILVVLGLLCAKILLHTLGLWQRPAFRYFPLGIDLFLQPLLLLYVLALTEPQRLNKRLFATHLALPFLFLLHAFSVYSGTVFLDDESAKSRVVGILVYDGVKRIEDVLSVILGIYYGTMAYAQLRRYSRWVDTYSANTAVPTYQWLRTLLWVTAVVLVLLGLMLVSQQFRIIPFVPIQLFYTYLVFLIYVFGFFGFRHQEFTLSLGVIAKKSEASSNTQLAELWARFEQLMQGQQLFLEPDLNLHQCADRLNCSTQILSEAIRLSQHKNFRDCVNHFRIEDFKRRIVGADLRKETIMGVAYASGFNSEPSFYRIFKDKTGITPKEFLRGSGAMSS